MVTNQSVKQGIKIFKAGDKEKARLIFKDAIQSDPNDEMAWFWLAATYKNKSNQIKCLKKLLDHQSPPSSGQGAIGAPSRQKIAAANRQTATYTTIQVAQETPPPLPSPLAAPETPSEPKPEEDPSAEPPAQWKKVGLVGFGIFGFLAVLVGLLFGNALFSVTDLNTLSANGQAAHQPSSHPPHPLRSIRHLLHKLMPLKCFHSPLPRIRWTMPLLPPSKPRYSNLPTAPPLTHDFPCLPQNTERVQVEVVRVVDGDTIDIEYDGKQYSVRYIGIDAPETYPKEYFSTEATEQNSALVEGQTVTLVKDISNTDQYGRLLRYVLMDDIFINQLLVSQGYALVATFPPDIACAELFDDAQESARLNNKGLWKNIPRDSKTATPLAATSTPAVEQTCPFGCKIHYAGCDIKGNITLDAEKIYHLPGSEWYDGTIINTSKGERWFCTIDEAEDNGWRAAQ